MAHPKHLNEPATTPDPDALIREIEAANLLGVTPRALQNWRLRGGGPAFIRISSSAIRYRRRDLIDWINQRVVHSTSEIRHGR